MATSPKSIKSAEVDAAVDATVADARGVQDQLAQLRDDVARLAEALAGMGRAAAEDVGARVRSGAETLKSEAAAEAAKARDKAAEVGAEMTDYARAKPVQAMAMAAGAGLMLGLLLGRR